MNRTTGSPLPRAAYQMARRRLGGTVAAFLVGGSLLPLARAESHSAGLVGALRGEDAVARYRAEEQLVTLGDEAVEALGPLATSPGLAPARQYAIIVLARIGNKKAIRLLLDILRNEQGTWNSR